MSQGTFLTYPRWSVGGHSEGSVTARMAGLPASKAMVWVGPSLFCSPVGSRRAGVFETSPVAVNPHEPSSSRL